MQVARRARGPLLTLGSFLGLLALYQGLIGMGYVPPSPGLTLWENNRVRAEAYAYTPPDRPQVVVVGSSLMYNTVIAGPGRPDVVNLAMIAGNTQTGAEIVRRTPAPPGVLVAEVNNTIFAGTDKNLVDDMFGYGRFGLRKTCSMFQTRYRPAGTAYQAQRRVRARLGLATPSDGDTTPPAAAPRLTADDEQQRDQTVARLTPVEMQPLSGASLAAFRRESEVIRSQITRLEAGGWRVLLCDVPRDSRLAHTVQRVQLRKLAREVFPEDRYRWVSPPPDRDWATRDGNHIVPADAKVYAEFLWAEVQKFAVEPAPPR